MVHGEVYLHENMSSIKIYCVIEIDTNSQISVLGFLVMTALNKVEQTINRWHLFVHPPLK